MVEGVLKAEARHPVSLFLSSQRVKAGCCETTMSGPADMRMAPSKASQVYSKTIMRFLEGNRPSGRPRGFATNKAKLNFFGSS